MIACGSFGIVSLVKTDNKVSVKKTIHTDNILECLLECIIMKTIHSKYLINADNIVLYIGKDVDDVKKYTIHSINIFSKHYGNNLSSVSFISDKQKLSTIYDICMGILHIHSLNLIHGDIKPENVLYDGKITRLCDFGMTVSDKSLDIEYSLDNKKVLYSLKYRPPEAWLYSYSSYSKKSDVWAFGMLVLYILFGVSPIHFYGEPSSKENLINYLMSGVFIWEFISNESFSIENKEHVRESITYNKSTTHNKEYLQILHNIYNKHKTHNTRYIQEEFINSYNRDIDKYKDIVELVAKCIHPDTHNRPTIETVLEEIEKIIISYNRKSCKRVYTRDALIPLKSSCDKRIVYDVHKHSNYQDIQKQLNRIIHTDVSKEYQHSKNIDIENVINYLKIIEFKHDFLNNVF